STLPASKGLGCRATAATLSAWRAEPVAPAASVAVRATVKAPATVGVKVNESPAPVAATLPAASRACPAEEGVSPASGSGTRAGEWGRGGGYARGWRGTPRAGPLIAATGALLRGRTVRMKVSLPAPPSSSRTVTRTVNVPGEDGVSVVPVPLATTFPVPSRTSQ